MNLHGQSVTRRELAALSGDPSQFFGVALTERAEGAGRGIRELWFHTATGLRFSVLVDRCMDIGVCAHRGRAIGWQSPTGFVHPGLLNPEGEGGLGFLRGFSGLLNTCGLDHTGFMHGGDGARYHYAPRRVIDWPLHGRANGLPATLTAYGTRWDGDEATLYAEGVVAQAAVFGEHLTLTRRIEVAADGDRVTIHDRVENRGFYRTPHMILYHIDLGHPVVAAGSRYLAPIVAPIWVFHHDRYRAQGVGYRSLPPPANPFMEQVWQHAMQPDAQGVVPLAVVNDAAGFGVLLESHAAELPCHLQWQHFQAGAYAMGIEPGTNHVRGHGFAEERGELIELEHGEGRDYHLALTVLDGGSAIAAAEARIVAVARQPDDDYPEPTGDFPRLR